MNAEPETSRPSGRFRVGLGVGVLLLLLLAGGSWIYQQFTYISITDARVSADMIAVSSRVAGWVTDLQVTEGDTVKSKAILVIIDGRESQLQLDELDAKLDGLTARRKEIETRIHMTEKLADRKIEASKEEVNVLQRQLAEVDPQERELHAQREQTRLDLVDRTIRMPFDGVVDRVFVDAGEYITPGQRLMMVHNPADIRIEANVKETNIHFFQPGKAVEITVDALPGQHFDGEVTVIGQAATGEFALLPNPNPSGNFTKITQRLRVRFAIHQPGKGLKPGMMVELKAQKRD